MYKGRPYAVQGVVFHACPDCEEKVYSPEAMRKIEAGRPVFLPCRATQRGRRRIIDRAAPPLGAGTVAGGRTGMNDPLTRIKRAVLSRRYLFTEKAQAEMEADRLDELDIIESIVSATAIEKTLRSTSPRRAHSRERLYVIESRNLSGTLVYTKGKLAKRGEADVFYFLVSAKRAM
jgi:hypothetical protein